MRTHVVELLPMLVAAAMADATGAGAPSVPVPSVNVASFTILASAAAEHDFALEDIRAALGRELRPSTPGGAVLCTPRVDPDRFGCQVIGGIYLELNGLVVSPIHAEAILTVKWTQWTARRPMAGARQFRVRYRREHEHWVQTSFELIYQT